MKTVTRHAQQPIPFFILDSVGSVALLYISKCPIVIYIERKVFSNSILLSLHFLDSSGFNLVSCLSLAEWVVPKGALIKVLKL